MTIMPGGQHRAPSDEDRIMLDLIEEGAEIASRAFDQFREQQTKLGGEVTAADKANLRLRLEGLGDELDRYLATEYGIDPNDPDALGSWRESHQPFHWFAEFYGIMEKGGFDVVIGNPPYVEYRKVRKDYQVKGFRTEKCGNLYALVMERSIHLSAAGHLGLIIPVSAVSTDGFSVLRDLLIHSGSLVVSHFNDRPAKLFDGIEHNRLSIILLKKNAKRQSIFSTTYNKWSSLERPFLFERICFTDCTQFQDSTILPKLGNHTEVSILEKFNKAPKILDQAVSQPKVFPVHYTRKLSYFVQILDFIPKIYDSSGALREPSELKTIWFNNEIMRDGALGFWNSSLFYWLITTFSDCRNLNRREIEMGRLDFNDQPRVSAMASLSRDLMTDIESQSQLQPITYKDVGVLRIQATFPRKSKKIIDELDSVLAQGFGLTSEELDFIINYDIKYRMGRDGSDGDG